MQVRVVTTRPLNGRPALREFAARLLRRTRDVSLLLFNHSAEREIERDLFELARSGHQPGDPAAKHGSYDIVIFTDHPDLIKLMRNKKWRKTYPKLV